MIAIFSKRKVVIKGSYLKLPIKDEAIISIVNNDKMGGICSAFAFLHPPGAKPRRVGN